MDTVSSAVCRGYSTRGRFRPGLFTASSHVFAGAGFSAYFVELHKSLQNDIIARTENRV
jgi:hypothetical protein